MKSENKEGESSWRSRDATLSRAPVEDGITPEGPLHKSIRTIRHSEQSAPTLRWTFCASSAKTISWNLHCWLTGSRTLQTSCSITLLTEKEGNKQMRMMMSEDEMWWTERLGIPSLQLCRAKHPLIVKELFLACVAMCEQRRQNCSFFFSLMPDMSGEKHQLSFTQMKKKT